MESKRPSCNKALRALGLESWKARGRHRSPFISNQGYDCLPIRCLVPESGPALHASMTPADSSSFVPIVTNQVLVACIQWIVFYTHISTQEQAPVCIYINQIHQADFTYLHTYTHTYIHIHICSHMHTYMHTNIHMPTSILPYLHT